MKKIICNSLEDGGKPKVVYNSAKLSQYFNLKDSVPQKYKSDLVYKCTCPQIDCNESYIGETERPSEERIINHTFTNIAVKIVIPTFGWTTLKYLVGTMVTI